MSSRHWTWILVMGLMVPYAQVLWAHWWSGSSHAMASLLALMAAVVCWWVERDTNTTNAPQNPRTAYLLLGAAVLAYSLAVCVFAKRTLVGATTVAVFAALVFVVRGRKGTARMVIPLALLLFVTPFPPVILEPLSYFLVDLAAGAGGSVLGWIVSDVEQHGSLIRIGTYGAVEVIQDCSGLEGVLLFIPLAMTVVHFQPELRLSAKLLVVVLALPLALLGNLLRIVITGLLLRAQFGLNDDPGFHNALGVATLGMALVLLLLLPRFLRPRRARIDPQPEGN